MILMNLFLKVGARSARARACVRVRVRVCVMCACGGICRLFNLGGMGSVQGRIARAERKRHRDRDRERQREEQNLRNAER